MYLLNRKVKSLLHLITNHTSKLSGPEYKVLSYILAIFIYEPTKELYLFINEIDKGMEFFKKDGTRTFYSDGLHIGKKKIERILISIAKKKILNIEEIIPHEFYKITQKNYLR